MDLKETTRRLAVLIDADNAQACVIEGLLSEIASKGEATVKRIYGDFTSPNSAQWKKILHKYAIKPVQQFAFTTGKNATDSALIIDAMDLMHTGRFDGFCLVSSDSDFTSLATRIREEGLTVYGFGEEKTPAAFRNACHKFTLTELLRKEDHETIVETEKHKPEPEAPPHLAVVVKKAAHDEKAPLVKEVKVEEPKTSAKRVPLPLIRDAVEKSSGDDGWANLAAIGTYLTRVQPDFDSKLYGHTKLSSLMKSHPVAFEIQERSQHNSDIKVIFVRRKT